ncbi:DUF6286 domain-containing protein [Streptomyces sp. NPDC127084]|uniref:DUF6286 domain-containing protein n=1 Tax=Streptomyces sp. NPDC127084 TaxID=3347133 RepID=UPI00364EEE27
MRRGAPPGGRKGGGTGRDGGLRSSRTGRTAALRPYPPGGSGEAEVTASAPAPESASAPAPARAARFWSKRRVPSGLVAALLTAGAGLLLYDIAAVRAERPAGAWRRALATELEQRPLDDVWVLVGASVAVLLGLLLIVLAVTPGLRGLLPMRRPADDTGLRAGLDRDAAALALRDRAMEVSGVQSVRVRMRRSRVSLRAVAHFRELGEVRSDLDMVLDAGIRELGLARPPAPSVRVRRPPKKG